jgi:hypothetical protein
VRTFVKSGQTLNICERGVANMLKNKDIWKPIPERGDPGQWDLRWMVMRDSRTNVSENSSMVILEKNVSTEVLLPHN